MPGSETRKRPLPDDLFDAASKAAIADERPLSSWVRIAVEEKLKRDSKKVGKQLNGQAKPA